MTRDKRRGREQSIARSSYANTDYPEKLKRKDCIYLSGEVTFSSRGVHKVYMENGMEAICTASKMDHKRVGILLGDNVTVEIPAVSLSPGCSLRGRIVWRMRPTKHTD